LPSSKRKIWSHNSSTSECRPSLVKREVVDLTSCASSHPYRPLYLCFSGFALCLYSWSNIIQRSTFAKRAPKPPSSLIQIRGWLGPAVFFNPNTNESTRVGYKRIPNGLRIHPAQHNDRASRMTGEPPLESCQSHLGHLGHSFIASRRYGPFLYRITIIILIFFYYQKGARYLVADSIPELPGDLPLKEVNRLMGKQMAILRATSNLVLWNNPVRLLVSSYTLQAVGELVYEQFTSLKSISGVAAAQVPDVTEQSEQAA
jgi:hypothetical protein